MAALNDLIAVDDYTFSGAFTLVDFKPGVPSPTDFAAEEWEANPTPRCWPYVDMHSNLDRIITGFVSAATEAAARAELALIVAACKSGATLTWQPDGFGAVTCRVKLADVEVTDIRPQVRSTPEGGYIPLVITLRTTPYWLGPEVTTTLSVSTGAPFTASLTGVSGDIPALTRVRLTHAQATTLQAIALRSNPGSGFDPIHDYSGVADAAAFGGETTAAYHGTGTPTLLGTPGSIDVGDNRGDFRILARVKQEGSAAATYYRAVSTVTPAIGPAYSVTGSEVNPATAGSAGFDVVDLGILPVPAGRVQAGLSGMAYADEVLAANQWGTSDADSSSPQTQTFTVQHDGILPAIVAVMDVPSGSSTVTMLLKRGPSVIASGTVTTDNTTLDYRFELYDHHGRALVNKDEILSFELTAIGSTTNFHYRTAGGYSGGSRTGGGDLKFKVYERPLVVMGATVGVEERCTEATKDTFLDCVALLPTDEACVVTHASCGAGEGVMIDYLSDNAADHDIYICDATQTGISIVGSSEPGGPPFLLRPGDNTLVGMLATPGDAAPGDATLVVTTRSRYRLPLGE